MICLKWKDEIDEVYSLARNIQRTEFSVHVCDTFVRELRLLELNILKSIVKCSELKDIIELDSSFLAHRLYLVKRLKKGLCCTPNYSTTEEILCLAINRFLSKVDFD